MLWKPEEVVAFAKDCIANGVEAISLGGGEPFEYDGIFDVIEELRRIAYVSVTTNGMPLMSDEIWDALLLHAPDKVHFTIHNPDDTGEVDRVINQVKSLSSTSIKPGVNLLVSDDKIEHCRSVYGRLTNLLQPDQIILVPRRFGHTPTPKQMAAVTDSRPFQSASCLLGCNPPSIFVSVSYDKKVNRCSYAGGKQPLKTLDYKGLLEALSRVNFQKCK